MASTKITLSGNVKDVNILSPEYRDVLLYSGGIWFPGKVSWDDLTDVPVIAGGSGVIVKDEGIELGQATVLDFVGDAVTVTYGGSTATISISGGGESNVQSLDDLTDVNIPSPVNGQVLTYNGTEWVATSISVSGTGGSTYYTEDLTSQIPAVGNHFTVTQPIINNGLEVYWNGLRQEPSTQTVDLNGLGFTLTFSPVSGDTLVVDYLISSASGSGTVVAGGRYRQFTYVVYSGDFHFIIDETGNPIMTLQELE